MRVPLRHIPAAAALAGILLAAAELAAQAPRIGTAAVSRNDVSGTLGAQRRALKPGDGVFQAEAVATGANSNAQVLFLDETALTLGPESRVILDKLIYDPQKRSGEVALRAVSGAFRFVSGSSPSEKYTIQTPKGTIGVRGTILEFTITAELLTILLREGAAIYCAVPSRCVTLNQPGTYIVSDGTRFSRPQLATSLGCGTGTCSIVDINRPVLGQRLDSPGSATAPSPLVTPNFRSLQQKYHGNQ